MHIAVGSSLYSDGLSDKPLGFEDPEYQWSISNSDVLGELHKPFLKGVGFPKGETRCFGWLNRAMLLMPLPHSFHSQSQEDVGSNSSYVRLSCFSRDTEDYT